MDPHVKMTRIHKYLTIIVEDDMENMEQHVHTKIKDDTRGNTRCNDDLVRTRRKGKRQMLIKRLIVDITRIL
jgi:hypothetical protein